MKYTDNMALIILLRLLLKAEPLELVAGDISKESQDELLAYVKAINYHIDARRNCLNISCKTFTIILSLADKNMLNNYLAKYANDFNEGIYTNIDSMETLKNELISTRNVRKTISYYPLYDIRFIPYILSEYYNNKAFIKNIDIKMENPENVEYPIKIYNYFADGEPAGGFYHSYEDYFDWEIIINLENYINIQTQIKKNKKEKNVKKKKFSKKEKKLFNFLFASATNKIFTVTKYELLRYCSKGSFDVIKSRLNKKYNEIYNKDIKLLSYNRTDEHYVISKEILE